MKLPQKRGLSTLGVEEEVMSMENKNNEDFTESSPFKCYQIPGEPAIVINGLPALSSNDANLFPCPVIDAQSQKLNGFGELLVGREVRKLFGEQFFNGKVTKFDEETGWYKVSYDDGDSEDLEWHELEEVLLPLDVNIPLETLARKFIKKRQKSVQKSVKDKFSASGSNSNEKEGVFS